MNVKSVLIEYSEGNNLYTSSATLFNKQWIIFPASSLILFLSKNKVNVSQELRNMEPSKIYTDSNYLNLKTDCIKVITASELSNKLNYHLARYVGIFACKNIKETISDFPLVSGNDDNNNNSGSNFDNSTILPLFVILNLNINEVYVEDNLLNSMKNLIKISSSLSVQRGSLVLVESIPFGCRELVGSYSQGVICNNIGTNNCFLLTDAPTAPGSEGAPMFIFRNDNRNSPKIPIGMVLSPINWWRGEATGLSLGVMLMPLLLQLIPSKWGIQSYLFSKKNTVMHSLDKSIVQVFCDNGWGTGILIHKALGLFITVSHVVTNGKTKTITLKWRNKRFPCNLIYRTENSLVFDIAILQCAPEHVEKMRSLKFTTKPITKGENVFAVGYPIFNMDDFVFPVVTRGNISLVDDCILHTTCCILAGASGGAIVRTNGELIGVIVSHTTATSNNSNIIVFPRINMAIPIAVIAKPILSYIKTKDVTTLNQLETQDIKIKKKWNFFKAKL